MNNKIRNLKVVKTFSASPRAHLPLSGRWLERAGFSIGMEVNVIVRNECLIILPKTTEIAAIKEK
jgi:Toxin SymE, type I toxin-antitoxin system